MKVMKQTLHELVKEDRWLVKGNLITCELIGVMNTGEKVWQDANEKQYTRIKIAHHFYFVKI